jgi:hypothetical protein
MKKKVNLVTNPDHETRKTKIRTRHVQKKNPKGFYCKNEIRTEQGCDKKKYPQLVLNI